MKNMIDAGLLKQVIPEIATIEPPYHLWRYDLGSDRYYLSLDSEGLVRNYYLSVTAFSRMSLATSPFLIEWVKKNGVASDFLRDERAAYGTTLHMYFTDCLKAGKVNFDECREYATHAAISSGYPESSVKWMMDLPQDIAAIMLFYKERVVSIVGMEFPISSDKYGLAGTIDLIAKVRFNKLIINAIIDLKSGRNGFYETHEMQLHTYKTLWNDNYSGILPVNHVFNLAPTNWRNEPNYNLVNQSRSVFGKTILSRMRIAKHEGWVKPPVEKVWMEGSFNIDDYEPLRHVRHMGFERINPIIIDDVS